MEIKHGGNIEPSHGGHFRGKKLVQVSGPAPETHRNVNVVRFCCYSRKGVCGFGSTSEMLREVRKGSVVMVSSVNCHLSRAEDPSS